MGTDRTPDREEDSAEIDEDDISPGLEEIIYCAIGDMAKIRSLLRAGQVAAENAEYQLQLTPKELAEMLSHTFEAAATLTSNAMELMARSERANFRDYENQKAMQASSETPPLGTENVPGEMDQSLEGHKAGQAVT